MLEKKSIFFVISLSFVITFIFVIFGFYQLHKNLTLQRYKQIELKASSFGYKFLIKYRENLKDLGYSYKEFDPNFVKNSLFLYTFQRGRKIIHYIKHGNDYYFYLETPHKSFFLKDNHSPFYDQNNFYIIFFFTMAILFILYIVIIKKLLPLKELHKKIKNLADEEFAQKAKNENDRDEISLLFKEYERSAERLRELRLSREIFIRNIMHELKTPIAKGKFILDLPENKTNKKIMEKVFYRLQSLIEEYSQIEKFLSADKKYNIKVYPLQELIDSAIDISFYDEHHITLQISDINLHVDFHLFTIALKNLIDNGIKYSYDKHITITAEKNKITFTNRGEKLKYPFHNYLEPFYNSKKGAYSMGIYITNQIIKSHDFSLDYRYENGYCNFIITFLQQ